MAFKDVQHFMRFLEDKGELVRIKTEVDADLEITEITDRVSKNFGKALLFENVKGSDYPVLINSMGSDERMSWALGVEKLDDLEKVDVHVVKNKGAALGTIEYVFKKKPLKFEFTSDSKKVFYERYDGK